MVNKDYLDNNTLEEIKKVSYKEIESLLADGGNLIDVRNEEEYKKLHLDDAVFWLHFYCITYSE